MHAAAVFEQENSEFEHWREFSVCARALSGSIRWLENLNGGNNWEVLAGRQEMTLKIWAFGGLNEYGRRCVLDGLRRRSEGRRASEPDASCEQQPAGASWS